MTEAEDSEIGRVGITIPIWPDRSGLNASQNIIAKPGCLAKADADFRPWAKLRARWGSCALSTDL